MKGSKERAKRDKRRDTEGTENREEKGKKKEADSSLKKVASDEWRVGKKKR